MAHCQLYDQARRLQWQIIMHHTAYGWGNIHWLLGLRGGYRKIDTGFESDASNIFAWQDYCIRDFSFSLSSSWSMNRSEEW